jgi:FtsP/CotA-like multicopper oxidase with cupredoxin domain
MAANFDVTIEGTLPVVQQNGFNTNKIATFGGNAFFNGTVTFAIANVSGHATVAAINATATATAAQIQTGYITSTSAAATTITFPTGTLLGAQLGATQGSTFRLYVDNTAGANTVTMAVSTNAVLSALAVANAADSGLLTIPSGVTGTAEFTLVFSSATAYTITRTA